jgi:hypothetical protein
MYIEHTWEISFLFWQVALLFSLVYHLLLAALARSNVDMKVETSIKSEGARLNNSSLKQLMSPSPSRVQCHHQQNE